MSFNTYPYSPFPASTEQLHKGDNEDLQAQIDAIEDGTSIDSFKDVENALELKADSGAVNTALGAKCNLSNIAPTFDAETGVYAVGDQVIQDGVLYEFTSAHETAGDWDPSEVQAVKISDLIDTLKSGLIDVNSKLNGKATFAIHTMGGEATVNIYHSEMVLLFSDRGGLYGEGIANRGLQGFSTQGSISVTHVDANNLTVQNTSTYGTSIMIISGGEITVTEVNP